MYEFCYVFLMFFIFSIVGWIVECIYCSIYNRKVIVNRGFLIGPYCPIYGLGIFYAYTCLTGFETNPIAVFLMAMLGGGILEYITSFVMEKAFNARWWDYSDRFMNINGRICIQNLILFGIIGLIFIYLLKPIYVDVVGLLSRNNLIIITLILMTIFIIDNIVSFTIMSKIKNKFNSMRKDSTEDIEKEVNKILSKHSFYFRKIFRAFPNVSFRLPTSNILKNVISKILRKENKK